MHDSASQFTRAVVEARIGALCLENSNQALVDHWFSLWDGDAREQLSPGRIKPFLPSMIIFEVVPDQSVTVRLADTAHRFILEHDPTGSDWIAAAPANHREARLRTFSAVARGGFVVAHRRIAMLASDDHISEEIIFPLAARPSGSVPVVVHVNFRQEQIARVKSIAQVRGDPIDHRFISFV